jgi:hypothetical protein
MAKAGISRKRRPQRLGQAHSRQLAIPFVLPTSPKPQRGMKLKTVSRFVMVFAVMCLLAFWAGRMPAVAGPDQSRNESTASDFQVRSAAQTRGSVGARPRTRGASSRRRHRPWALRG